MLNPKYIDPVVDWRRVVGDLQRVGMTWSQQAKEVGVSRRTIGNWQHGICEPSYSCGHRMLDIYNSVFGTSPSTLGSPPLLLQMVAQKRKERQDSALRSV